MSPTPVEAVGPDCSSSLPSLCAVLRRYQVQIALRLLNARVSEHELNDPNVDAVSQQTTGAFVSQVVPAEVDSSQLLLAR